MPRMNLIIIIIIMNNYLLHFVSTSTDFQVIYTTASRVLIFQMILSNKYH